jgi:hypothetical protein
MSLVPCPLSLVHFRSSNLQTFCSLANFLFTPQGLIFSLSTIDASGIVTVIPGQSGQTFSERELSLPGKR